ncbi:hypothetical protein ACTJJ0_13780 [Chitinophaga sp. 22321]|uniref:Uncharacterized protein n=1 Tax=Chitinophaga hostae TaxID=2831022 RepID=A0ABS5J1A5_9BACT|nr:hypothetical protein [Chitinophaga hostae]MBS0029013.1 hypothetical protein [Chitinophaga hostae]
MPKDDAVLVCIFRQHRRHRLAAFALVMFRQRLHLLYGSYIKEPCYICRGRSEDFFLQHGHNLPQGIFIVLYIIAVAACTDNIMPGDQLFFYFITGPGRAGNKVAAC